jgi:hypothetical protein
MGGWLMQTARPTNPTNSMNPINSKETKRTEFRRFRCPTQVYEEGISSPG